MKNRSFESEILKLKKTHVSVCEYDLERLRFALHRMSNHDLLSVGSGGSLTTAVAAASFFASVFENSSKAVTPFEMALERNRLRSKSVFIASAGGSNPDAVGALRMAARSDARLRVKTT